MATTNDITGDAIKSRVNTPEFSDNWDRIFGAKLKDKEEVIVDEDEEENIDITK